MRLYRIIQLSCQEQKTNHIRSDVRCQGSDFGKGRHRTLYAAPLHPPSRSPLPPSVAAAPLLRGTGQRAKEAGLVSPKKAKSRMACPNLMPDPWHLTSDPPVHGVVPLHREKPVLARLMPNHDARCKGLFRRIPRNRLCMGSFRRNKNLTRIPRSSLTSVI